MVGTASTGTRGTSLLLTKLYIPPVRSGLVPRPHLVERLTAGGLGKLTLISAAAGFGKTTLAAEWSCRSAREVAWVSLDRQDNDPVQFLRYVIAALQQVDGSIGRTLQQILDAPQLPPPQGLITSLINDISSMDTSLTLVLDDYHLITSPLVHEIVTYLIEHQPPAMHLAISTRHEPPLPLARLRARGQVTEIHEGDLRLTAQESILFLERTLRLSLPPQAVQALVARTQGWAAGLQLAALALQQERTGGCAEDLAADLTAHDRYIADYLVTEVLDNQPTPVRAFLRQTAILDKLTAPLCDAITGRDDSQAMLGRLTEGNLFINALDHHGEWYRYDHLFADILRGTLDRDERARLHRRAARWYEANGHLRQAIDHALTDASTPEGLGEATRLIRAAIEEALVNGGVATVQGWLGSLPIDHVRANAELATYSGWVRALSGDWDQASEYAQAAERLLSAPGTPAASRGRLLSLRSFLALLHRHDDRMAIQLAADALRTLGTAQAQWRVLALWTMAEAQERTSDVTAAIATLRQARQLTRTLGNCILGATVESFLATTLYLHGERDEAVTVCKGAIQHYTDRSGRPSPVSGLLFSQLGALYYETNQLQSARRCLDQGLALGEQLGLGGDLIFALARSAQVCCAQGERQAAFSALHKAHELAIRTGFVDAGWPRALEANLRLQEGDVSFAHRWATAAGFAPDMDAHYLRIEQHLVYARLLLTQGRLSDARRSLARLEQLARARGLRRWLITVHILQALTVDRTGDRTTACELLSRALRIGASGGYYRSFLDEGVRAIELVAGLRHVAPRFIDRLLADADVPVARQGHDAQLLVEPLSERELEVLRLIAAGLPNREIAGELIIALGTVKRHINHIYGKLYVHSRTQAIAQARALQILD